MRKQMPEWGDERTKTIFVWFPKTLYVRNTCNRERRWLEFAEVIQMYDSDYLVPRWRTAYWAPD